MEEKIVSLISDHFGIPVGEISQVMELRRDLNATDLELADFFQILEKTFNVVITKEDAASLTTISDTISYINDHAEELT